MKRAGNVFIALLMLWGTAAGAAVEVSVDRVRITESDSLELTIRATAGESVEDVDLDPLKAEFDVVSTSTSSRLSIINGRTERTADLNVVLLPKHAGDLTIPSLRVGTQRTREILIEVLQAPSGLDNSRDVFVEAEVDHGTVYVQSQLIHTFRVYEAIDLVDRGRSQLEIPDAVVEELDSTQFQRNINGRTYRVIEVRHAIFPQKSGQLTIPSMSFNGSRLLPRRSFFDRNVETLRRRSRAITVDVKPIPAAWPDAPWIPAADLKLEESWSALPDELKIGDSVTRTVTVLAQGIDGSQLPPLEQPDVPGIKTYPDQPKSENTRGPDGITGIGINSTALLVTESGSFELPAIRIPWWDTETDRLRYAELPAHRLEIKATPVPNSTAEPAAPAATTSPAPSPAVRTVSSTSMWMWTTLAALLGWLATTGWLMWRMQPRRQAASEERTDSIEPRLFRELAKACEANEAANARAALTRWGQRYFGEAAPPTLQTLAGRFASEDIRQGLDELERSLFSPSGSEWSGRALVDALRQWRKNDVRRRDARPPPLAPLYRSASGTSGAAHGGV